MEAKFNTYKTMYDKLKLEKDASNEKLSPKICWKFETHGAERIGKEMMLWLGLVRGKRDLLEFLANLKADYSM